MGVNPGRCNIRQAPSLHLLVKPITRVGLLPVTMIQTHLRLRCPWRPARRDVQIGFPDYLLFTPLCGLRISRYRRGDAVPRSPGIGNCAQHRASSCQGSDHLAFHPQAYACFERTDRTLPASLFGSDSGASGLPVCRCFQPPNQALTCPNNAGRNVFKAAPFHSSRQHVREMPAPL